MTVGTSGWVSPRSASCRIPTRYVVASVRPDSKSHRLEMLLISIWIAAVSWKQQRQIARTRLHRAHSCDESCGLSYRDHLILIGMIAQGVASICLLHLTVSCLFGENMYPHVQCPIRVHILPS